ncbi:MAG: hypothetical protein M3Q23_08020 [Actinomycetota bacterium]|nr:hypothetical protein [Actinomycetota bacterium]
MTTFPGSPRLLKGAIVGIDPFNPLASVVIFQYNPDSMTRQLQAQTTGAGGGGRAQAVRLKGAPVETIGLTVEIDAVDQLETGDGIASTMGVYPQLSALEMLLYPKSALVIANTVLTTLGTIETIAPEAPMTLFVWGVKRVLPVRLTGFTITEEAYDVGLNPIRAKVALSLRVLSYSDLSITDPGYYLFLAHQVMKEVMATIGSIGNAAAAASGSVSAGVTIGG